jgi:hypothetical protein
VNGRVKRPGAAVQPTSGPRTRRAVAGSAPLSFVCPAGVGFSYSNTTSDYTVGDARAAVDVVAAIQAFLVLHPSMTTNDLYLSGESYAGHYVPTTARAIIASNSAGATPKLNFKGFAVGERRRPVPVTGLPGAPARPAAPSLLWYRRIPTFPGSLVRVL